MNIRTNHDQSSHPSRDERGVLIVLLIAFMAILIVTAVGFYVYLHGENRVAENLMGNEQAKLVAQGGLESVIRAIHMQEQSYTSFPCGALFDGGGSTTTYYDRGTYLRFYDLSGERLSIPYNNISPDPDYWLSGHTNQTFGGTLTGLEMRGRVFSSTVAADGSPDLLENHDSWVAAVTDLDGRLNLTALRSFTNDALGGTPPADDVERRQRSLEHACKMMVPIADELKTQGLNATFVDNLLLQGTLSIVSSVVLTGQDWPSYNHIVGAVPLTSQNPDHIKFNYLLERYIRASYRSSGPSDSHLNINTAPDAVVKALVVQIPSLDPAESDKVKTWLIQNRPFLNWSDFEKRLFLRVWNNPTDWNACLADPDTGKPDATWLTARQFNDILQSFSNQFDWASRFAIDPTNYFDAGQTNLDLVVPVPAGIANRSGIYKVKWKWKPDDTPPDWKFTYGDADALGASLVKGVDYSSADPETTWGQEIMFKSSLFHIVLVGRAANHLTYDDFSRAPDDAANRSQRYLSGEARLQAIYRLDTPNQGSILWFRWNVTPRGNIGDY